MRGGISRIRRPEGVQASARRLRREGKSAKEIALALGVPQRTVTGWVAGIEPPSRTCLLCGDLFYPSWYQQGLFCSHAHYQKYKSIFGPVSKRQHAA